MPDGKKKTESPAADPEQITLDLEAFQERFASLEKARSAKDETEARIRELRAALRQATRADKEAAWNLSFWQRQLEQFARRKKDE